MTPISAAGAGNEAALKFEFLMRIRVEVDAPVSAGIAPMGEARVINILGGTFDGPALRGEVLPGGSDWQIIRADGALDLDARYVLRASDGAVIRVVSRGLRHGPPEVLERLARGEDVDASLYVFRSILRFETGAPTLSWLNRTIGVATAERKARLVELQVFSLL